jgi:hypothetical protein
MDEIIKDTNQTQINYLVLEKTLTDAPSYDP